jgi:Tol biopolymer transport system component
LAVSDSDGGRAVASGTDRRWAWIAVLFGVWLVGGVVLVVRALNRGDVTDVGMSPYHVVVYGGLLVLVGVVIWRVVRARRNGLAWRSAFPTGYGALGAGMVVLLATVILDVAWREGVGIEPGIENTFAPSRILLVVGLSLVAMTPLRASLLAGGDRAIRWPAAISAGLLASSLVSFGSLNVIANPWLQRPANVVEDNNEIWLMDADGGRQTRLLEGIDGADLGNPVWSPDSKRIAYTRTEESADVSTSDVDIWVANADGTDAHPLATGPTWQWFPRWSPDGAWLAYTDEAVGGPWLSSGPVGPDTGQGPQGPVFPGANATSMPEADLWRLRVDGSGPPQRITNAPGDDRSGAWSPDGARLAFDSTRDGNTELYIVDADGTDPVRLTNDPAGDWAAAWSPDGTRIAFTSDRTGSAQIWVIAVDGSGLTQVTDDRTGSLWPAWSPDGSRIAFTSWDAGSDQVWSMAADGSDRRDLSHSATTFDTVWDGSWGPDGRIAFMRAGQPPAALQPIAREDLGVAAMLASALAFALVVGLLALTRPVFGAVAVAMGVAAALAAGQVDEWQFVPAAAVAGLMVDVALRLVPNRRRVTVGAAGAALGLVAALAAAVMLTTGLGWSPTLLIGTAAAAAIAGWGIGALLERHAFSGGAGGDAANDGAPPVAPAPPPAQAADA